jgi:ribonuclease J
VDGTGVGDVGNVVLRDRRHLSEDGIIVVVATIDAQAFDIISGPEIVSRGFVYAKESEHLIEQIRMIAREALYHCLDKGITDWAQLKYKMKDDLSKFIYSQTKRKPMILPIIMDM